MNDIPTFYFALREDIAKQFEFLPHRSTSKATGYDVRAANPDRKDIVLRAGHYFKIHLGFRYLPPEGWYFQLHPRSSTFAKKQMHCLIGIVDEDWEGETCFVGQYMPDISSLGNDLTIKFGDPIGQIIPVKRELMEVLGITNKQIDEKYRERGFSRGIKSSSFTS